MICNEEDNAIGVFASIDKVAISTISSLLAAQSSELRNLGIRTGHPVQECRACAGWKWVIDPAHPEAHKIGRLRGESVESQELLGHGRISGSHGTADPCPESFDVCLQVKERRRHLVRVLPNWTFRSRGLDRDPTSLRDNIHTRFGRSGETKK